MSLISLKSGVGAATSRKEEHYVEAARADNTNGAASNRKVATVSL